MTLQVLCSGAVKEITKTHAFTESDRRFEGYLDVSGSRSSEHFNTETMTYPKSISEDQTLSDPTKKDGGLDLQYAPV